MKQILCFQKHNDVVKVLFQSYSKMSFVVYSILCLIEKFIRSWHDFRISFVYFSSYYLSHFAPFPFNLHKNKHLRCHWAIKTSWSSLMSKASFLMCRRSGGHTSTLLKILKPTKEPLVVTCGLLNPKLRKHHDSGLQQVHDALNQTLWYFCYLLGFFIISLWGFFPSEHEGTHCQASPSNSDSNCVS